MRDIKGVFEKFSRANFFSRVDNSHILEIHLGLDEHGRKAIELRSNFTPRKVTGTASIEVNQYKKPEYNTIRFSLCDEDSSALFYMFCEDLVEQTKDIKDRSEGYTAFVNRFFQWKKMFVPAKGKLLSEAEIMGLIGEVLYLRGTLAEKIGLYPALKSWSGQELTHKDFSYGDTWTEVKTTTSSGRTVRISSLEQLSSEHNGELAVYSLEKMSTNYHGITLNRLIVETRNMFSTADERDQFMTKVALQGYEFRNLYDDYVFEVKGYKRYLVNSEFPKLTVNDVNPAIKRASYELSLSDIASFEIT